MQLSLSRRALFRGQLSNTQSPAIRPPWAQPEHAFLDLCSRCDKCASACESNIIIRGDGGYPQVDFTAGECTFCNACEAACPDGALQRTETSEIPWNLTANIGAECLSANGITCRVCGDRCDARAIQFKLAMGGVANPVVDASTCTGCGACVAPCPVNVITIEHRNERKLEEAAE